MTHVLREYVEALMAADLVQASNLIGPAEAPVGATAVDSGAGPGATVEKAEEAMADGASAAAERAVTQIAYHTGAVVPGTLFVCKGRAFQVQYLAAALAAGAIGYVAEQRFAGVDEQVPYIVVRDMRAALVIIANTFHEDVWRKLTMIGITGTKGKTTTNYMLRAIIDEWMAAQGKPASAMLSSIEYYDGVQTEEAHLSTPETFELHQHMANAVASGIEVLEMEVTSQALKYGRVGGIQYDVGCFLNITEDHISAVEHQDFADYYASKLKLFAQTRVACVCHDLELSEVIEREARAQSERVITFGEHAGSDVRGYDIVLGERETTFRVRTAHFDEAFRLRIPGRFNVQNALGAIAISYALGVPAAHIRQGLYRAAVPGRMELFSSRDDRIKVIVDYAHNKLSFENLFGTVMEQYPGRQVIAVFGSSGGKAQNRRRELGEISSRLADIIYLTEDDAGSEDVTAIAQDIQRHMLPGDYVCEIIPDRTEAVRRAILGPSDAPKLVLLTGKGHETTARRAQDYVPIQGDIELAQQFLSEYDQQTSEQSTERAD